MSHPVHDNHYARKDGTPYAAPLANRGPAALQHLLVDDRPRADEQLRHLLRPELVHLAAALDELAHRCRAHLDDWGAATRPWEPAGQPEHAFDESSVVNPATGEPYRGSTGPEPYEPPDPLCVCGAPWLGDEGCLTQQPGWTPPPPYDGPSIEELLPPPDHAGEPDGQPEAFDMERLARLSTSYAGALEAFQHGDPARSAAAFIASAVLLHEALGEFLNGVRRGRAEPASGGVVEPSPPAAEEQAAGWGAADAGRGWTPDPSGKDFDPLLPETLTVRLDNRDARFVPADPPVPLFEGDEALPHPPRPRPRMTDGCGPEHTLPGQLRVRRVD